VTSTRDQQRDKDRPAPFSSPDCDLRGLEWMPLDTINLLESTLFLESTGDEFKAAMALICKSWRQVPAGSLPNSEKALAILSSADDWTAVRTMAMRNWVLCSDGRWYHPKVAAKAMEALPMRQDFVEKKTAEADRKERERKDRKEMFAKLRAAGIVLHYSTKTRELRERVKQLEEAVAPAPAPPLVTPNGGALVTDSSRDLSRLRQGPHSTPQELDTELPFAGESATPPAPTPSPPPPPASQVPAPPKRKRQETAETPPTSATWDAYAAAFEQRYQVPPTRNAKVNGQLAQFVTRMPAEEAPHVAAFYLRLPGYAAARHPVALLLRDEPGIRTQWLQAQVGRLNAGQEERTPVSARAARMAEAVPGLATGAQPDPFTLDVETRDVTEEDRQASQARALADASR
jgi:hypothetical protein